MVRGRAAELLFRHVFMRHGLDQALSGDDAIARVYLLVQTKIARAMLDELIELLKRAIIEKELHALPRTHFAGVVLFLDACCPAALLGLLFAVAQLIELRKFRGLL